MTRKLNKGLTLIEVMAALVIALVIAIGMMSYQYAGAQHARNTDVRVTASRIGLLFLEDWVAVGGIDDDTIYDPLERLGLGEEAPFLPDNIIPEIVLPEVPGLVNSFKSYGIFTNGTWFWVKLTYNDEYSSGEVYPIRELGVSVAWSLDFQSPTLEYDSQRLVHFSKYVIYVPPASP